MFVYKLYTNGHPYDTSLVWCCLFKTLIEAHYIPAIIIPKGFPNQRTFSLLNSFIPEEFSSGEISFKDDAYAETGVESYYDFKAERIKESDLLLTEDNIHSLLLPQLHLLSNTHSRPSKTLLKSSTELSTMSKPPVKPAKPIKDLTGTLFTHVMEDINADSNFDTLKVCITSL